MDSEGTGILPDDELAKFVDKTFDLRPAAHHPPPHLKRPIYQQVARLRSLWPRRPRPSLGGASTWWTRCAPPPGAEAFSSAPLRKTGAGRFCVCGLGGTLACKRREALASLPQSADKAHNRKNRSDKIKIRSDFCFLRQQNLHPAVTYVYVSSLGCKSASLACGPSHRSASLLTLSTS